MATNDDFFKKAEEFGKELKNHSSKYLKEIKVILHDCLEPFFNKWWDEASQLRRKSEGGDGIYSKYKPSQLVVALKKSRTNFKPTKFKTPKSTSDVIGYFYLPTTPQVTNKKGKKLVLPKSYYQMLEWGIEPHSLGKGNITKYGARQRLFNTSTSKGRNKGYYDRRIDVLQDSIARKREQLAELYRNPNKNETVKTRKGRGYTYSTVGEKIQKIETQIKAYNDKISDYRQRWQNVNRWSSGGAHDVIRTQTSNFWHGKRFQKSLGGAQFMRKARESVSNEYTKKAVKKKFMDWIKQKVENMK